MRTWGEPVTPHEEPQDDEHEAWVRKPHWEIAEPLGMIDLAAGAKITGSGFPIYKGAGSRLQRALIDFFLDLHTTEHGMTEVWPPVVVNEDSARGTGPDPRQGRPDVRRHARRPLPGAHRRGAGHQHPPRRDHRGRGPAHPLRGLLALLPARGRRGGRQDARHPAGAPVRQGRDGRLREAGGLRRRRSSG